MSKSAVILQFPTGEPLPTPPPDEEDSAPRRSLVRWVCVLLAGSVVAGTVAGALTRPPQRAMAPPDAPVLSGVRTVNAIDVVCRRHPRAMYRAQLHGVFYSGIALQNTSGALYATGPIPPSVTLNPSLYPGGQYRHVVVSAWPGHEQLLAAGTWVTVTGIVSCIDPVQIEYLASRNANP